MKNRFSKKVIVSIILIMIFGFITAGCGTTAPPTTPIVQSCYITVYSQHPWCWGYVWVNGLSTGKWIAYNGAVTVSGLTAGTTASVQILDNFGALSHSEILVLTPGNNIVTFTYWL